MNRSASQGVAELGVLQLALSPRDLCSFPTSPARSLHAALLRRLELLAPDLTQALHDGAPGLSASDHPWTISPLLGHLDRKGDGMVAVPGRPYRCRITALAPEVLATLSAAFDSSTSLGREPLLLEHVGFDVVDESSRWEAMGTYPSLLTFSRPGRLIVLRFRSVTGFRSTRDSNPVPSASLCVEGYLRKWNAFSDVLLPENDLLEYVREHLRLVTAKLRPAIMRFGRFYERGVEGEVAWESDGSAPALLRLVNALVDYAFYCGTGWTGWKGTKVTRR